MYHHNTIKKYTAAILDMLNDLEIQYERSDQTIINKSIPITYSSIEKSRLLDHHTSEQLASGNYNVLPRAHVALSTMVKSEQRITNKNVKINTVSTAETFDYMYNSVPYEFTYELTVACRGMNEASMVIEQIAPKFNPVYNIDVWDADNLDEPTRIPVKLLDISIETEEYEELSSNVVNVNVGFSLMGNMFPPVKSIPRIKEFKMILNEQIDEKFTRKSIMGWDVNDSGALLNGEITSVSDTVTYPPTLLDIIGNNVQTGNNDIEVIYEDKDNKITELTFNWVVLSGPATITSDLNNAILNVSSIGSVDVQVTVTDPFGNFASINKVFTIT